VKFRWLPLPARPVPLPTTMMKEAAWLVWGEPLTWAWMVFWAEAEAANRAMSVVKAAKAPVFDEHPERKIRPPCS